MKVSANRGGAESGEEAAHLEHQSKNIFESNKTIEIHCSEDI